MSRDVTAPTVWGALRGLETFSQLPQMNGKHTIRGGGGLVIVDTPRFPWRGLMLDPARHFIDIGEINSTIDAMAQNKLNTLHIHLTDGESFTVNTEGWAKFPLLSAKGSFAPQLTYTKNDLAAVVAHGRLRGVRVIPEFDLPAHMVRVYHVYWYLCMRIRQARARARVCVCVCVWMDGWMCVCVCVCARARARMLLVVGVILVCSPHGVAYRSTLPCGWQMHHNPSSNYCYAPLPCDGL